MIDSIFDFLNPEFILLHGGVTLLFIVVFMEAGIFFGFFLPGDSLLFITGLLCDSHALNWTPYSLIAGLTAMVVLGTMVGYATGRWAEHWLRDRPDSFFYKKNYMDMTLAFYEKRGMMTFIIGRFLPVVRTFIPILAGIARIDFVKFMIYNFLGAFIWITTMVMSGYLLGNRFPLLNEHVELIVIGMVLVTSVPLLISFFRKRKQ
ncbi:MAG: DedA family protein [Cyclobacteriaceae bacterium]|nr:DedA family protein [Cyclobacteriaceae bacterium]